MTHISIKQKEKRNTLTRKKIIDLQRQTSIIRKEYEKKKLNQMSLSFAKTNIRRVSLEFGGKKKSDPTLYKPKTFPLAWARERSFEFFKGLKTCQ